MQTKENFIHSNEKQIHPQQQMFLEDPEGILENTYYEFFEDNRYKITDFKLNNEEYSAICNNGFIKMYSNKCKAYWLCQNEKEHTSKDWKFHVSVDHSDIKKAWNLIAKIFLKLKCRSGMKVYFLRENLHSAKGREITIYIFKYDKVYVDSEIKSFYDFDFCDEHSREFWVEFFSEIELCLKNNKIKPNGLAKGDLKLGDYVSLRNEAYVKVNGMLAYPPDELGWNAAGHELPFDVRNFGINDSLIRRFFGEKVLNNCFNLLCFTTLILSVFVYKIFY